MIESHNDKVVIAYYDFEGKPQNYLFSFYDLPRGSAVRAARCNEYNRQVEALKGQGLQVHCWDLYTWQRYRKGFLNGKLRKNCVNRK